MFAYKLYRHTPFTIGAVISANVRTKNRKSEFIRIRRLHCQVCGAFHRELPDFIFPYKQYESEIIRGVLDGLITCETLGFEDYPCEMTMLRWLIEFSTEVVCT